MLNSMKCRSQIPWFKHSKLKFQTRTNDGARLFINDEQEFQSIFKSFLIDSWNTSLEVEQKKNGNEMKLKPIVNCFIDYPPYVKGTFMLMTNRSLDSILRSWINFTMVQFRHSLVFVFRLRSFGMYVVFLSIFIIIEFWWRCEDSKQFLQNSINRWFTFSSPQNP